jgi:hypothetical protein
MTVRDSKIHEYDSQEDGGPQAPKARYLVVARIEGEHAREVTAWTNDIETVLMAVRA